MNTRLKTLALNLLPLAILGIIAFLCLEKVILHFNWGQISASMAGLDQTAVLWALAAAAASYTAMIGYDLCAVAYAKAELSLRRICAVSFAAFAAANTLGFGAVSSGAVRYRLYSKAGISPAQIAKMISFVAIGFTLGILCLGAIAVLLDTSDLAPFFGIGPLTLGISAGVIIGAIATLIIAAGSGIPIRIKQYEFALPKTSLLLQLLPLTFLDLIAAGVCLWVLLPEGAIPFYTFLGLFIVAMAAATLSHVPAGLGVFDAAIFFFLSDRIETADLAAALIVYRIVYYFVPFCLALMTAGVVEYKDFRTFRAALKKKLHLE